MLSFDVVKVLDPRAVLIKKIVRRLSNAILKPPSGLKSNPTKMKLLLGSKSYAPYSSYTPYSSYGPYMPYSSLHGSHDSITASDVERRASTMSARGVRRNIECQLLPHQLMFGLLGAGMLGAGLLGARASDVGKVDVRKLNVGKVDVVVVDHDSGFSGAFVFAAALVSLLSKRHGLKCLLLTAAGAARKRRMYQIPVLEYLGDSEMLYRLLRLLAPAHVLFNSANYAMAHSLERVRSLQRRNGGTLTLHSHEVMGQYLPFTVYGQRPDFVVSSMIAEMYPSDRGIPEIQPPVLLKSRIRSIRRARTSAKPGREPTFVGGGQRQRFDRARFTVAMVGSLDQRKNPRLFVDLSLRSGAESMNFVWIGGSDQEAREFFKEGRHIFHVTQTSRPWTYLAAFADAFLLSSLCDPCPYALLEALLVGLPCLAFRSGLKTDLPPLRGQMHLLDGDVSAPVALRALLDISKSPVPKYDCSDIIKRHFSELTPSYLQRFGVCGRQQDETAEDGKRVRRRSSDRGKLFKLLPNLPHDQYLDNRGEIRYISSLRTHTAGAGRRSTRRAKDRALRRWQEDSGIR